MPRPRKALVSLDATPYYHCVSRCVRRAFLCGEDQLTGQNSEHRGQWIENRLLELGSIFAIDVCAYAVMSNHYHVVLKINHEAVDNLTDNEVIDKMRSIVRIMQNGIKEGLKGTFYEDRILTKGQVRLLYLNLKND